MIWGFDQNTFYYTLYKLYSVYIFQKQKKVLRYTFTMAPQLLLANSQRVATRVFLEVLVGIFKAARPHPFNATLNNSTVALSVFVIYIRNVR